MSIAAKRLIKQGFITEGLNEHNGKKGRPTKLYKLARTPEEIIKVFYDKIEENYEENRKRILHLRKAFESGEL